jgi:hypothetical protein
MSNLFTSFTRRQQEQTGDQMASELARDTICEFKELRALAIQAEKDCEPSKDWDDKANECIQTLDALMRGRHAHIVKPIVLTEFPEIVALALKAADKASKVGHPSLVRL